MKHFLKTLLALCAISVVGCVSDPVAIIPGETGTIDFLFDSESYGTTGEVRYGIDCQDRAMINEDAAPYIVIPYMNSTSPTIIVEDIDAKGGIYVAGSYISAKASGETVKELYIPIKGIPAAPGAMDISFSLTYGSTVINKTLSIYILGSEDDTKPLSIGGVEVVADIVKGTQIQKNEDGEQYVLISYSEGWNRSVVFEIDQTSVVEGLNYVLDSEPVDLYGGSYDKTVAIPISGSYTGTADTFSLPIIAKVQSEDYVYTDATYTLEDVTPRAMKDLTLEFEYSGFLQTEQRPIVDSTFVIKYTNGEYRQGIELELSFDAKDDGIFFLDDSKKSVETRSIVLDDLESEGQFEFTLTGLVAATAVSEIKIKSELSNIDPTGDNDTFEADNIPGKTDYTLTVDIDKHLNDPVLSNAVFKGPINTGDESFSISFDYACDAVDEPIEITLSDISGYLTPYADELAAIEIQTIPANSTNGTLTFELGTNFFESTTNQENIKRVPSWAEYELEITYNNVPIAEKLALYVSDNSGFVWEGYSYNIISLSNGQVWLDRNIGATSIKVDTEFTISDSNTIDDDSWEANFAANGHYFQRGRATGIPIEIGGDGAPLGADDAAWFKMASLPGEDWESGYFESPDSDWSPTTTADYAYLLEQYWWPALLGETNNPCPIGYRVPTATEATEMISTVCSGTTITSSNAVVIPTLAAQMNMTLSGSLNYLGPYQEGVTKTNYGTTGIAGVYDVDSSSTTAVFVDSKVGASSGYICLATSDYNADDSDANYVTYVRILNTGTVSTQVNLNRAAALPVRCIKY